MPDITFTRDPSPVTPPTFTRDAPPQQDALPSPPPKTEGLVGLLPKSIQEHLPSFLTGPSIGERLSQQSARIAAEEKRLGRQLSLAERLKLSPIAESPLLSVGLGTRNIGEGGIPGAVPGLPDPTPTTPKIQRPFQQAIKPSVGTIKAAGGIDPYRGKALSAIGSIVRNKDNLQFSDEAGNVSTGRLPQSLEEFADAINQTKQKLFDQYDTMAQQSGQTGIHMDLTPVVNELDKIASDTVVQDLHPELASYAKTRGDALRSRGEYLAPEAQRAITMLNSTLKSFYAKQDYATAVRASVDSLIANKLRSGLDDLVENTVAPGYQQLKTQYGSLKAIERDVKNRAAVTGRQEPGGGLLGRISDVASAHDVIRGVLTFDPISIARGVGLKAWAQHVKYLRSPNRLVSNIFDAADRALKPTLTRAPIAPVMVPEKRDETAKAP